MWRTGSNFFSITKLLSNYDPVSPRMVKKRFQVEIYQQLLDILVSQLGERFKALSAITEKFNLLSSSLLDSASDDELYHLSECLRENTTRI